MGLAEIFSVENWIEAVRGRLQLLAVLYLI